MILLLGASVVVVVIIVLYWLKVLKPKRIDQKFDVFSAIVGPLGKTRGFKRARTSGAPQLLVEMESHAQLTSLVVQYGHDGNKLGLNTKSLNVAGYHRQQGLKYEFFIRPNGKPSPVALRSGPQFLTGNETFDSQLMIVHANAKAQTILLEPRIQKMFLEIADLTYFEIRLEGVRTLIWGERKGISKASFSQIYTAINSIAEKLI